jgi:ABC-type multidrug transport system ATPase subunit
VRALLEASDLTVRRGRRDVLGGVELAVHAGAAVHLTGANGSGKTSLLRVLAGLAAPRAGTLRRWAAAAFVPDRVLLAPALRCHEWLGAMRGLRGLESTDWSLAVAAAGLDPGVLEQPSARLSKGMLQRVALVEALHAGCPLLLLDEPFSSLDAASRDWLAGEVGARAAEGAGILFTDHSSAAGDRLAPVRVLELRDGRCRPRDAAGAPRVAIAAVHPDGRRLRRAVAPHASDGLLRDLLADGWHVESVGPEEGA